MDTVEGLNGDVKKQKRLVEILVREATAKKLLVYSLQKTERYSAVCLKKSEGELSTSRSKTRVELEKLRVELQAQRTYITLEIDARDDASCELHLARVAT